MLQRVLAGLTSIEGVEQAMLVDDNGHLMACVGSEGEIPPIDTANQMVSIALETCTALGIGQLYEIWCEGKNRMMIDIAGPDRIVVLSGKGGRLARWRHALDRDRRIIATTPQM
jgi:predicted regulator of Ras-like GTPase activity (Roadblock/LC7/MglB family)|tara:strand:+ start:25 stop:366 length:342 start_codon:yes stop_codon:yes gene_type:complete